MSAFKRASSTVAHPRLFAHESTAYISQLIAAEQQSEHSIEIGVVFDNDFTGLRLIKYKPIIHLVRSSHTPRSTFR